jgi:CYTH domain-containing protein
MVGHQFRNSGKPALMPCFFKKNVHDPAEDPEQEKSWAKRQRLSGNHIAGFRVASSFLRHVPKTGVHNPLHSLGSMTVRRRFLIAPSFARLIQRERGGLRYVEGFFPEQRDRSSWVRLEEDRGLLILKTLGPDGAVEDQTEIPVGHAHALLDVSAGMVDYTRTALPISEGQALVDEIIRPRVLHLVTIEFDADEVARSFRPLEWFGPEVTADPRYTHQYIALRGLAEAPEVPLSDAALNSLIDTLEGRFPAQARMASTRPRAKQVPVTRAKAQTSGETVKVNLDEIEQAMVREIEKTLPKDKPG